MNTLIKSLCIAFILAIPQFAWAHSPIKGIEQFYNGLLHPVLVPAHLLLLIAFGFLFGQKGIEKNLPNLSVFIAAIIIGLIAASFEVGNQVEIYILGGAAIIGLWVAVDRATGIYWYSLIAVFTGFLLGMDSTQETLSGSDKFAALFGSGIAIYFLSVYPMALAEQMQKKTWGKIGIRIAGSWIAASSILVFALSLSSRALSGYGGS